MAVDREFWRGRRVLVTGHTGFKGSWLCCWLASLEARVTGLGLAPITEPALFDMARIGNLVQSNLGDMRDPVVVRTVVGGCEPEIVFHLAAQPLVLKSLEDPVGTLATNVMGTVHLLEALREIGSLRAAVIVTSDKCYRDVALLCSEEDALGGTEPYSASKACAEIVVGAWRSSFLPASGGVGLATARAGNVIGGGDFSPNRLVPDLIRGARAGKATVLRFPHAVRPWQHVLDALSGYLMLAQALAERPVTFSSSWNFGPTGDLGWTVAEIADEVLRRLGHGHWTTAAGVVRAEAPVLRLSSTRARHRLGWRPRLSTAQAIAWTVEGYRDLFDQSGRSWLERQVESFAELELAGGMPSALRAVAERGHV